MWLHIDVHADLRFKKKLDIDNGPFLLSSPKLDPSLAQLDSTFNLKDDL